MKRTEFIEELKAFAKEVQGICLSNRICSNCALYYDDIGCRANIRDKCFDADEALDIVEKFRNRNKSCAEVIDRAVDVYTIEVEVERNKSTAQAWTPKQGAEYTADYIKSAFQGNCTTVSVLSAKRFVQESHREESEK